MLTRLALFIIFAVVVAKGFWRLVDGIFAGATGKPGGHVPSHRVQMVRDPVCGTFLLPDRALTLGDGGARTFFCSDTCRDKFRASA